MDLELRGKTVVVTGGAKGIGAAIIRAAAEEGADTIVIDRDEDAEVISRVVRATVGRSLHRLVRRRRRIAIMEA